MKQSKKYKLRLEMEKENLKSLHKLVDIEEEQAKEDSRLARFRPNFEESAFENQRQRYQALSGSLGRQGGLGSILPQVHRLDRSPLDANSYYRAKRQTINGDSLINRQTDFQFEGIDIIKPRIHSHQVKNNYSFSSHVHPIESFLIKNGMLFIVANALNKSVSIAKCRYLMQAKQTRNHQPLLHQIFTLIKFQVPHSNNPLFYDSTNDPPVFQMNSVLEWLDYRKHQTKEHERKIRKNFRKAVDNLNELKRERDFQYEDWANSKINKANKFLKKVL